MKQLKKFLSKNRNNYLFFLILSFLMVSTTAVLLSKVTIRNYYENNLTKPKIAVDKTRKNFPPIPVLKNPDSYPVLSAQGVVALDLESGITLYEKNPDAPLLPASTTKIITAMVSMDAFKFDEVVTVGREVIVTGQKMGLYPGEQIKVEDLLKGLLIYSANDAAMALAYHYPGGYKSFVEAMNQKAINLSMNNTRFDNPVGLDGNLQRSTARDLARASEVAMRNPDFAKIVGMRDVVVTDITGKSVYSLKNLNVLLGSVEGVIGVKTGWTESARENLVTYIVRDNRKIVISLLGSQDRFGETRELIDWIMNNYMWEKVVVTGQSSE